MRALTLGLRARLGALDPELRFDPTWRRLAGSLDIERGAVLEVGCGPGWVCIHAAAGHPELDCVGIDTDPGAVAAAERNRGRMLNATFRVMDGAEVRYPEATFDRVLAARGLRAWTDPAQTLAELRRVVRPGGVVMLCDPDPEATVPPDWVTRVGPWPPEALLRASLKRRSLGDEGFERMRRMAEALPWCAVEVDRLGFYRRILLKA